MEAEFLFLEQWKINEIYVDLIITYLRRKKNFLILNEYVTILRVSLDFIKIFNDSSILAILFKNIHNPIILKEFKSILALEDSYGEFYRKLTCNFKILL